MIAGGDYTATTDILTAIPDGEFGLFNEDGSLIDISSDPIPEEYKQISIAIGHSSGVNNPSSGYNEVRNGITPYGMIVTISPYAEAKGSIQTFTLPSTGGITTPEGKIYGFQLVRKGSYKGQDTRYVYTATYTAKATDTPTTIAAALVKQGNKWIDAPATMTSSGAVITFTATNNGDFTVQGVDELTTIKGVVTQAWAKESGTLKHMDYMFWYCIGDRGINATGWGVDERLHTYYGVDKPSFDADGYDILTMTYRFKQQQGRILGEMPQQIVHLAVPKSTGAADLMPIVEWLSAAGAQYIATPLT